VDRCRCAESGPFVAAINGTVIAHAAIGFADGKLTLVADARIIRLKAGAFDTVVDISGKHVYPGLIALNTVLGLSELEQVRATRDFNETGELNPSVRSLIAYDTDSRVTPTVRSNGVLLAEVVPQGGLVTGLSSVMMLDGWNWEDAAYATDVGIHLRWPDMDVHRRQGDARDKSREAEQRRHLQEKLLALRAFFDDARAYARNTAREETNLNLEAMRGVFDGSRKLFIHAQHLNQIEAAMAFCSDFGLRFVLVGGRDAWRVSDRLKTDSVAVVVTGTHALPLRPDDDIDGPYKLPFLLQQAGVPYCISVDGFWQVRNLSFQAGTAAAYGLTAEQALTAVTLSPARILGIDATTGSLEEGKDATLVVADGDLLDMATSRVGMAFIRGKAIDLDNMQKQLYRKYKAKYGLE